MSGIRAGRVGILVDGGPAPGINGVIGAAAIEAINNGREVVGIYDGFKWLSRADFDPAANSAGLRISDVARIHFDGGSILRTARASLLDQTHLHRGATVAPDADQVRLVRSNLARLGVSHLITIGGDDTALSARFVAEASSGRLRVVHVPKTIDNDLPLPGDMPTFGFNTGCHHGALLVANLMEDARTTSRWYVVVTMGRHAGFLALGIGKAASATLTLVPEEFAPRTTLAHVVDVLEAAILKRRVLGRRDGVAVLAEGISHQLGDRRELEELLGRKVPVDAAGHLRLAEFPLDQIIKRQLQHRFAERGETLAIVAQTLGYELRCAPPTPFDMSYCRDLGHGSVRLLLEDAHRDSAGVMVAMVGGDLRAINFTSMMDPHTGRTRLRTVDLHSESYRVARAYMIRLAREDLDNTDRLAKLAAEARTTPSAFRQRFISVVADDVPPPDTLAAEITAPPSEHPTAAPLPGQSPAAGEHDTLTIGDGVF